MPENTKKAIVYITKISTGETREHEDTLDFNPNHTPWFMWEDGNYSCDCNRQLFFDRAGGEESDDSPCSEGKYKIKIVVDNETIYEDA